MASNQTYAEYQAELVLWKADAEARADKSFDKELEALGA